MDTLNTKIRFVHNVYNGPLVDIYLQKIDNIQNDKTLKNEKLFALNLKYEDIIAYSNIEGGYFKILIKNSDNIILSDKFKLGGECTYTFLINGNISIVNSLAIFKYKDITSCPKPGKTNLTFIHGLCGAGDVNIYVNDLKTPLINNMAYSKGAIVDAKVGQVQIPGGEKNFIDILIVSTTSKFTIELPNFYAVNGGNYTIIISGKYNNDIKMDELRTISSHNNKGSCQNLQKDFNVNKYMGKWYQISSIILPYSESCIRSEANYTQLNNNINVYNICYNSDGTISSTINGFAIPYECNSAELLVAFPPIPTSKYANYLIHSTDYVNYAVVGSPTLTSCYILSRKMTMCRTKYNKLLKYCKNLGYDTNKIIVDKGAVVDTC